MRLKMMGEKGLSERQGMESGLNREKGKQEKLWCSRESTCLSKPFPKAWIQNPNYPEGAPRNPLALPFSLPLNGTPPKQCDYCYYNYYYYY